MVVLKTDLLDYLLSNLLLFSAADKQENEIGQINEEAVLHPNFCLGQELNVWMCLFEMNHMGH